MFGDADLVSATVLTWFAVTVALPLADTATLVGLEAARASRCCGCEPASTSAWVTV